MQRILSPRRVGLVLVAGWLCGLHGGVQAQEERARLAEEMEASLRQELEAWYPRVVDEADGGFLSRFTYDWQPEDPQDKMIVTQARHVWTASKAAERYPDDPRYLRGAAHGFAFLRDAMWDAEEGGFFTLVDRTGRVKADGDGHIRKNAYGNAFGLYGLAAYYHASGDTAALGLAKQAFQWLEEHSHDPEAGGYFQFLERDGTPLKDGFEGTPPKDQNSSIHLLEALTELYAVWPDPRVRERLEEMLRLIRDTITTEKGYLTLFLTADWAPVSYRDSSAAVREAHYHLDHVSYGHDVETAFLMLEAAEALGLDPAPTLAVGKRMVDHALRYGWDGAVGGFYDRAYYFAGEAEPTVLLDTKTWWAQAEGLNTLLVLADLFPADPQRYFDRFKQLWTYTRAYLLDAVHGGWYGGGLDKEPEYKTALKAHIWKGNYHTARSLMRCVDRLRSGPEAEG